jgi:hypothetical protein
VFVDGSVTEATVVVVVSTTVVVGATVVVVGANVVVVVVVGGAVAGTEVAEDDPVQGNGVP